MDIYAEIRKLHRAGCSERAIARTLHIHRNTVHKANSTNNIYAEDVEILRKEVSELSRTVNTYLSTLLSKKV